MDERFWSIVTHLRTRRWKLKLWRIRVAAAIAPAATRAVSSFVFDAFIWVV
jgi:hypothetical protein